MKNVLIAATFAVCATAASAQTLTVDSEAGVTYNVISLEDAANGNKEVTTRREEGGASTYAEHNVSCDPYRAGLISTGETLASLDDNPTGEPTMHEIIRGSAEDKIAVHACGN